MRGTRPQRPPYARAVAAAATVATAAALAWPAAALAAKGEDTPLDLGTQTTGGSGAVGSGGGSVVRAILALAVVVALIYGVRWALRKAQQAKAGRAAGEGMTPIASLPLGPRGTLHLVRVGDDVLLLGQAEGQLTEIKTYERVEAERLGMLRAPGENDVVEHDDYLRDELGWSRAGELSTRRGQRAPRPAAGGQVAASLLDQLRAMTVRR
jgi:flagellar biosynthetic protein FliO